MQEEQVPLGGEDLYRFCQLCGRFHALDAFDDSRRSCGHKLLKHNERRKLKECEHACDAKPRQKSYKNSMQGARNSPA